MIATSGRVLLEPEAIQIYQRDLFPLATLITPNLDEATRLLGHPIRDLAAMHRAARTLATKYGTAVLLKGGHLRGRRAIDVFSSGDRTTEYSAAFLPGVKTHGTGCTYSAAIAAELAKGAELPRAIAVAKKIVSSAIRSHFVWKSGRGKIFALNPQCSGSRQALPRHRQYEWLEGRIRNDDYFFSQSLFSRASRAASTSAACLLKPVPRPRTSPSQRASTTKVLACSGPVAESTS